MATRIITPAEQVANVQDCLLRCVRDLHDCGLTMKDALRMEAQAGRVSRRWAWKRKYLGEAYAALSALRHWRQVKAQFARGELRDIEDDGNCPF